MSYSESVSSSSVFSLDDGRLRTLASNADEEKGAVDPAARAGLTNRTGRAEAGTGDRGTRNGISLMFSIDYPTYFVWFPLPSQRYSSKTCDGMSQHRHDSLNLPQHNAVSLAVWGQTSCSQRQLTLSLRRSHDSHDVIPCRC